MQILVTGANGFVGRALLQRLKQGSGHVVRAALRRNVQDLPAGIDVVQVGDLDAETPWQKALSGIDVVIHTAARAHVMNDAAVDPLAEFRRVNVEGTLNLARHSIEIGVKRFIFISSIGVNGAETIAEPFKETSLPNPHADYAVSKLEAEEGLRRLLGNTSTELVVIRPPLVYGPNAPGNFNRLLRSVAKGLPLPLAGIQNQRSMVALENLVDFIVTCIEHPQAARELFLVADGEDVSTPQLIQALAVGMGKRGRLFYLPAEFLRLGATLLRRSSMYQQLCGSLQVDITKARSLLNWTPPVRVGEALRITARRFLEVKPR